MGIRENLSLVRDRIKQAKRRAPNPEDPVWLVGVTKGVSVEQMREALMLGLEAVGENRVQEAKEKVKELGRPVAWHMVGHLQTNKVRDAVPIFDLIHSVDSLRLAREIEKEGSLLGRKVPVLLQVALQAKETQFGVPSDAATLLAKEITSLTHVTLMGLMTIAPLAEDPERTRPYFRQLRELKGRLEKELKIKMGILSMGMSSDFEIAIEEGSTLVRIGRAIFGGEWSHE